MPLRVPPGLVLACSLGLLLVACGGGVRDSGWNGNGSCAPGASRPCYTGDKSTKDVGPCHGGMQSCTSAGQWGDCEDETVPHGEVCGNGLDDNCNGQIDEDVDVDGDGWTTCGGDCCDSSTVCGNPTEVNPGAFEAAGDGVDNDCDGMIDNSIQLCDQNLMSSSSNAMDYAKAIDLCQTATMADKNWGVIDAKLTLTDGTGSPDPNMYSIRHHFGAHVMPQGGVSMALISSGIAAGRGDKMPDFQDIFSYSSANETPFPADFVAANGGKLPNAPGCPDPRGNNAKDPVMLTLHIRVPTNAHAFSLKTNFYSTEYPEWTCSDYNDFFVVLLDSAYTGMNPNPMDKNLAFYTPPGMTTKVPVGVNLASGNTGLFTQCVNGPTGCAATPGTIMTCTSTEDLKDTGYDEPTPGVCDGNSLNGGATGWLTTSGNVNPGEIITLRIAIWDTSDHLLDSLAVVDDFRWSVDPSTPGTVILRTDAVDSPVRATIEP